MAATALAIAALAAVCAGAAAPDQRRYAAVDVSPRADGGLVPRFFIDEPKLAARDGGNCDPNHHSCVDIGHPEYCCSNSNYCYIKPDNSAWCCPIGSVCDSKCPASAYQCPTNVTVTVTVTPSRTGSGTDAPASTAAAVTTTTSSSACCGRACPSPSSFQCESRFGGGCCAYGETCGTGGACVRAVAQPTPSASGLLTPADPRCTAATQHACDDGGGCCDLLMRCTVVGGTTGCAAGAPTATDVRFDGSGGGGGLSTGAKAGIGVGVSVVGCVAAVALAWFCLIRRRRRRRGGTATGGTQTRSQRSGGDGASRVSGGVISTILGTGGGARSRGGGGSDRPGRSARAMSEVTSGSRPTARRGATQDYFGPDAVAGPYTETETAASDGRAAASTPGGGGGGGRGGVPLRAHSPSDITAAVEIDSRGVQAHHHDRPGGYGRHLAPPTPGGAETTDGRFELHGSDLPSPMSPPPPSPPLMTPRSIESVSVLDRSPGPGPSPSADPGSPRRGP